MKYNSQIRANDIGVQFSFKFSENETGFKLIIKKDVSPDLPPASSVRYDKFNTVTSERKT